MYHSITFGTKNTWDDWHLVPVTRPVFAPPAVKTKTIDIPGGDGVIDLTESLTGYPVYENRTGSFEFIVVNDFYEIVTEHEEWYAVYSDIMDYLHGQRMQAVLEDDTEYYYEGRFTVDSWDSEKNFSKISIGYSVEPYKRLTRLSTDDWLWDPFNFHTGTILSKTCTEIRVGPVVGDKESGLDESVVVTLSNKLFGREPIYPTIRVYGDKSGQNSGEFTVSFTNSKLGIHESRTLPYVRAGWRSYPIPEFIMCGNSVSFYMQTNGNTVDDVAVVYIQFRPGRL